MRSIYVAAILGLVHCQGDHDWQNFKNIFNKNYKNGTEDAYRRKVFEQELDYIEEHNKLYEQGKTTFTVGINKFSDWTLEEFQATMNTKIAVPETSLTPILKTKTDCILHPGMEHKSGCIPPSYNWRDLNVVSEVKDQGTCGSGQIYAAVGAIEGAWAKDTDLLYNLSGQEMVDCGKDTQIDFQTVIDLGGILTEEAYPYSCAGATCQYEEDLAAAHISSYSKVPQMDEIMLGTHLYEAGPITVLVDASLRSFKAYSSGIYWDQECGKNEGDVNHGLLLVAYDTRKMEEEKNFYTAKNSWGTSWGMEGYVQLRMWANTCNLARYGMYPNL